MSVQQLLSRLRSSLAELRRRRVFRAAAVYGVVGWLVIEVATATFPYLGLPDWLITAVIVLIVLGFPLALVLAWTLELTPEGVRPERRSPEHSTGERGAPGGAPPGRPAGGTRRPRGSGSGAWLVAALGMAAGLAAFLTFWSPAQGGEGAEAAAGEEAATGGAEAWRLRQVTVSEAVEEWPAFAPDGTRLVYSRDVNGHRQLFVRDLETGSETALTDEPADHIQPAWSPDGRSLLYVREAKGGTLAPTDIHGPFVGGDIWLLEVATGSTRRLLEDAYNPSFSPDGGRIAFDASWVGPRRIWVADAVGRNPQQVTGDASESVSHIAPRWSPDGSMLAFQSVEGTKLDVRTVHLTSGVVRWVTDDLFANVQPVWAPGGEAIYFSSNRGGGLNLWRIPVTPEGVPAGAPLQVTMGAGQDIEPAVEPGDGRVAFVTRSLNATLWRLPVDPETGRPTGPPEALISTTREQSRGAWSPDGRRVAFNSDRAGHMNLWVHALEDGSTRQVTRGPGGDFQPRWSPDGRRLVFFSSRSGNADIWTVEVETGALVQLTADSALQVNPFYSPDGNRIAFQSDRGGRKEVWVMDADGSNPRQLSHTGVRDHFMLWSEDGRSIIYTAPGRDGPVQLQVSLEGGEARPFPRVVGGAHMSYGPGRERVMDVVDHRALWVTPLSGGEPLAVFEFEDPDVRIDYPVWSPDGRWVLFDRSKPGGGDVWMLEVASGS